MKITLAQDGVERSTLSPGERAGVRAESEPCAFKRILNDPSICGNNPCAGNEEGKPDTLSREAEGVQSARSVWSAWSLLPLWAGPKRDRQHPPTSTVTFEQRDDRKRLVSLLFFTLAFVLATPSLRAAWVYESTNEFFASADFDGDGRIDQVIADKTTGHYRLGYQLVDGQFTWVEPRASGIPELTGFSVARFFNIGREALAFTAPGANRVNLFDAASSGEPGFPVTVAFGRTGSEVGPNLVVGLDIGGTGNRPLHDLLIGTTWNSPPNADQLVLVRNAGANAFEDIGYYPITAPLKFGNTVTLRSGAVPMAGVVLPGRGRSSFIVLDLSFGTISVPLQTTNLPLNANYVAANFSASPLAQVLFYVPGSPELWRYPLSERLPGVLAFGASNVFTLPSPIRQVVMLPGPADTKLLIISGGGETATIYNFNGTSLPTALRAFSAQPGETFTGAGALAGNGLMLYSDRDGGGTSSYFQAWHFNGTNYSAGQSGALPRVHRLSGAANVFFFNREPFVNNAPVLLRSVKARDWTAALSGLPGNTTVQGETFAGTSNGLRNPVAVNLGAAPVSTTDGLVNQYRDSIALFGHTPASGNTPGELIFQPEPGVYSGGVSVSISNHLSATIYYRLGAGGAWTIYGPNPLWLYKTTTIQAYAEVAGRSGERSRITTAVYTIKTPPGELDSDGDGVPDYVELAKGTDPSKTDTDRDDYSDLEELLLGAGPANPVAVERRGTFSLRVRPRPFHGGSIGLAASNTAVRLHDLGGGLLAAGSVVASTIQSFASFSNVVADASRRLLSVSTDVNFKVRTPPNANGGKELLGVWPMPEPEPLTFINTYTGNDDDADANAWIAANRAMVTATPSIPLRELTVADTLAAAVVERALSELLRRRGDERAADLTLFPARTADVSRYAPGVSALTTLESASETSPAYSLRAVALTVSNRIFGTVSSDLTALRTMTTNLYRISSEFSQNDGSGPVFPPPIEVLRQFFSTGTIHSNYFASRRLAPEEFSAAEQAGALRAVTNILADIPARPATNVVLQTRVDTDLGDCTLLDAADGGRTFALFNAQRARYRLLESFQLVPGSRVRVAGFLDSPTNPCGATSLEVVSLDIISLPTTADVDSNGNGLPDSWEALHGISDPNGDSDGDGLSNVQEMRAGTDPRDPNSHAVITIADSGPGSLRQAILHANATPGEHSIRFNIPGAGVHTIAPLTPLPGIERPVMLDGYSQPGASPNTLTLGNSARLLIELSGQNAGAGASGLGISASHCTIRGLCINRFGGHGIHVGGPSNVIAGNFIGTDPTGMSARSNGMTGVFVSAASFNLIGGSAPQARNVVSANNADGIRIWDAPGTENRIEGNYIGVNAQGTVALGNVDFGVRVQGGGGNWIGGDAPGAGNLISGNPTGGIVLWSSSANRVRGNLVGTDASGRLALPNGSGIGMEDAARNVIGGSLPGERNYVSGNAGDGIALSRSISNRMEGNFVGTDVSGERALPNGNHGFQVQRSPTNWIGGGEVGQGNLISGNGLTAISLNTTETRGNIVQGNFIGTDASGTRPLPNGTRSNHPAIQISVSSGNLIGGTNGGQRNVISGNAEIGVLVQEGATDNRLLGNFIGVDGSGQLPLPNGRSGVWVENASNNSIGGIQPGEGNVVAHNRTGGVNVSGIASTNNSVLGNVIYSNGGLCIDLGSDGPTINDSGDTDAGPNQLQNYPVLEDAITGLGATQVTGRLASRPGRSYRLEFFASSLAATNAPGDAERLLGSNNIVTDSQGLARFEFVAAERVADHEFITAIATDESGNSSEVSRAIPLASGPASLALFALPLPIRPTSGADEPSGSAGWAPPRLSIRIVGDHIVLSWTGRTSGYTLQQTFELGPTEGRGIWSPVPNTPITTGGTTEVILPANGAFRLFRLQGPSSPP